MDWGWYCACCWAGARPKREPASMAKGTEAPPSETATATRHRSLLANRALVVVSLLALALGVALGQAWITWLNATLL